MSFSISGVRPKNLPVQLQRQLGFTLVEVMMTFVLLAVSAALAIPSYRDMVEKRQLTNAAEQLAAFVGSAQTIASRTNRIVTVSYERDGHDDWCIGATMGANACDCEETDPSQSDYCEIDSQPFVLNQDIASDGRLMHQISGGSFSYDPVRGTFTDMGDSLRMEMHTRSRDYQLNLMVNAAGRVILCSDDSYHDIPGYEVCPRVEEES